MKIVIICWQILLFNFFWIFNENVWKSYVVVILIKLSSPIQFYFAKIRQQLSKNKQMLEKRKNEGLAYGKMLMKFSFCPALSSVLESHNRINIYRKMELRQQKMEQQKVGYIGDNSISQTNSKKKQKKSVLITSGSFTRGSQSMKCCV